MLLVATKGLLKELEHLEIRGCVKTIQTTLLRSARILTRILETWGDLLLIKLQWKITSLRGCEKLPSKSTQEKSKPGWEFRLENQIKNLRTQAKMIKQKKDAGIITNRKEKTTQEKLTIQLEEINQKVPAKEGRLKRYRQRVKQYRQNRAFQNNVRKFYQQLGGDYNKT